MLSNLSLVSSVQRAVFSSQPALVGPSIIGYGVRVGTLHVFDQRLLALRAVKELAKTALQRRVS